MTNAMKIARCDRNMRVCMAPYHGTRPGLKRWLRRRYRKWANEKIRLEWKSR